MMRRVCFVAVLLPTLVLIGNAQSPNAAPLVVHEWGTFTSIAGSDGQAVEWLPLSGPTDLPCFVNWFAFNLKGTLPGTVRMETPVLYFYGRRGTTVDVAVRFNQGVVTEWFPPAAVTPGSKDVSIDTLSRPGFASSITWKKITLDGESRDGFPQQGDASHYYLARQTDASPLRSDAAREKFLFYRGIGGFQPPVRASITPNRQIVVTSTSSRALGDIVLFHNHGGTMAYQVRSGAEANRFTFDPPALDGEYVAPTAELERILVAHGLYEKEAKAMIETWRDSWFEEGTRIFYIAPRSAIDSVLPLEVNPAPSQTVRVFVGRIELQTDARLQEVRTALLERDERTLRSYGRFLEPMAKRVIASESSDNRSVMLSSLAKIAGSGPASRTCR